MDIKKEIYKLEKALEDTKNSHGDQSFLVRQAISERLDKLRKELQRGKGRVTLTADNVEVRAGDKVYRFITPHREYDSNIGGFKPGVTDPKIEEKIIERIERGGRVLLRGAYGLPVPLGPAGANKTDRSYGRPEPERRYYSSTKAAKQALIAYCEAELRQDESRLKDAERRVENSKQALSKSKRMRAEVTPKEDPKPKPTSTTQDSKDSFVSDTMEGIN